MLKVRKSSWHYRLWRLGRENPNSEPKDLCRYFWHITLLKILLPATLGALVLVGIGGLLYVIYGHPLQTGFILIGVLLSAAGVVGLFFCIQKLHDRHLERRQERRNNPQPPKEPSLFREMLMARKRSMCPLIEVIDDREQA